MPAQRTMPNNNKSSTNLTPGQAVYVVGRLIKDRRITDRDVARMLGEMKSEVVELEQRLALLRAGMGAAGAPRNGKRAPSANLSPKTLESRRIQGEYMGLIRHLGTRE